MISALIIATGKTKSKDNVDPKKMIGSITAVERVKISLEQAGINKIVVVGAEDDKFKSLHQYSNITYLSVSKEAEMIDSVKTGLEYLKGKCKKALIVYVDVPMFAVSTIKALAAGKSDVCIPSYEGFLGHPLMLSHSFFDEVINYKGENGLKGAIDHSDLRKEVIEVDDPGVTADIQKDKTYKNLLKSHDASKLRLSVQLELGKEKIFFDREACRLLNLIDEQGSLSKACAYMKISLNKGRTIIGKIEEQLGCQIIKTQQGGANGGYSSTTHFAKTLMQKFDNFSKEADEVLSQLFKKHFDNIE